MEHQSNGVEKKDYPWKRYVRDGLDYSDLEIDKEEYLKAAQEDPLWRNVKSIQEKDPMIWEVYNSQVTELQKEKKQEEEDKPYCRFYNDRAYIVLCWHKAAISFIYDLHIWVSKHCSSEDYMLATVKAQQLNLFLDDKPILHREIQLRETDTFHTYFKVEVRRRAKETPWTNKKLDKCSLLQFHEEEAGLKGKKRQWMVERKFLRGNLCSDDVFVIMNEHFIYQWNGGGSNDGEHKAANAYVKQKEANSTLRFKPPVIKETRNDRDHSVYNLFPTDGKKKKERSSIPQKKFKTLYEVKNGDNKMLCRAVEDPRKPICKSLLNSNSIHFLDTESKLYVWIGDNVSYRERCLALFAAENFLMSKEGDPNYKGVEGRFNQATNKPITLVNEENPYVYFDRAIMN